MVSICGMTFFSDELVHSTTTSGFAALIAFFASSETLTFSWRPRPATSPRSRPTLAGSMSTAPTILKPLRAGDLPDDAGADRSETEVQDLDGARL